MSKHRTTTAPTCRNCGQPVHPDRRHKHPSRFCCRRCSQLYKNKLRHRMWHEAQRVTCHAK